MFLVLPLLFTAITAQDIINDIKTHRNWKLLDQGDECGLSSNDPSEVQTVGSHDAGFQQYPWVAALVYTYDSGNPTVNDFYCEGVVISERYVLTAASCKPPESSPNVKVRLGEYEVGPDPDCKDGVCTLPVKDVDVEEYSCKGSYDPTTWQNDICLVRLATPVSFNTFIYPICLPVYESFRGIDFSSLAYEIAGWGVTSVVSASENRSSVLQTLQVKVKPQSESECSQMYGNRLCACGGEVRSCSGDPGTPLMTPLSLGGTLRYFLAGVYSHGTTEHAAFTQVYGYLMWILDTVR